MSKYQTYISYIVSSEQKVGLRANGKKTKILTYNQMNDVKIKTIDGTILEEPSDFKYLGPWVNSTASDITVRKAMAWKACNAMNVLWRSPLDSKLKIRLFECTVESVLLYGCETWTLTLQKS